MKKLIFYTVVFSLSLSAWGFRAPASGDENLCYDFAKSLLPEGRKKEGWKSLLEVKYQNVNSRKNYEPVRVYNYANLTGIYYARNSTEAPELRSETELMNEADRVYSYYKDFMPDLTKTDVRNDMIIFQLKYSTSYNDLIGRLKDFSSHMSDQEYLKLISAIGGYGNDMYNDERAEFNQNDAGGKGRVSPFQILTDQKQGVCGDIHTMVAKFAELRGWEAFTVGFSLEGMQHVVTAVVDPKDKKKLMLVNYGMYEEQALNDGNSVMATPSGQPGWHEIGTQLRIFKNSGKAGEDGRAKQIATVPTSLGSFMADLFASEKEIGRAMPKNENYRIEKTGFESTSENVKVKRNGNKIVDRTVGNGIIIYEGQTENAEVFGLAVSHDVYKDLYQYNPKTNKCELKSNKYFNIGMANNKVDFPQADYLRNYYMYLNIKGGKIYHVYQSEYFQSKGLIGYEFDGFVGLYEYGFLTGDANLAGLAGVMAEYKKKNTAIHVGFKVETTVGMRDQNLMTDFSSLPTNLDPIQFNAMVLETKLSHKINPMNTFITDNNIVMTRVGGRVFLSTGILHKNTSLMLSYQGGVKALPIGTSLQNVNLLQNFNNMDGARLTVNQNFQSKNGKLSGTVTGWGGISTSTQQPRPMGGVGVKVNLGGNRGTPKPKGSK